MFKSLVLFALSAGISAHALQANRQDVNQAQNSGRQLTGTEATVLRGKVILAQAALLELHSNQAKMKLVGVAPTQNWATITLGLGTAATEIALGAALLDQSAPLTDGVFYKSTKELYNEINALRDGLARNNEQLIGLIAKPRTPDNVALAKELRAGNEVKRSLIRQNLKRVSEIRPAAWTWARVGRTTTLAFGYGLGATLIVDGIGSAVQIAFAPERGEEIERNLTKFVADARQTLADRR